MPWTQGFAGFRGPDGSVCLRGATKNGSEGDTKSNPSMSVLYALPPELEEP